MPLAPGTRLGSYEITASIGAGGMGEVYRARDLRLDRDVAVKILPSHLANEATALGRFEREAKAVAALSHPNILSIFDFGSEGGVVYAVMELLDGETLRELLGRGPLPARKALDYAVQIARGLAAAHQKDIVHRDLKPENVFVTRDGRIKILDFGLARQLVPRVPPADLTGAPTMMNRLTDPGTVLGTVGYMSPEQVRGELGDHRSDLFSLGAVIYEMVSGRRAFQRDTAAETMTAILREDPPELVDNTSAGVSPALARVIHHCLEKSPAERFQSASDVAFAMSSLTAPSTVSGAQAMAAPAPRRTGYLLRGALTVLALAAVAGAFELGRSLIPAARHVTFTPLTYRQQSIYRALFAPDGKTVVFSAALRGNHVEIFSQSPEYPEARSLGLSDAQLLSVSSKGELAVLTHANFLAHRLFEGTLARVALGGGAPREILEHVREADWSPDGSSLAVAREVNGRDRLEFPVGKVLYETSGYVSDLRVSPAGDRIAFLDHPIRWDDRGGVAIIDLAGRKTTIAEGYWGMEGLAWSPDGREVLFSAGDSYSRFTVRAAALVGRERPALESAGGLTLYDISRDGRWLGGRDDITRMMRVMPPGAQEEADLSWLDFSLPTALSADGRLLLFTEFSGAVGTNYATCLRKTDGSPVVHLGEGFSADLSPDGKWALAAVPGSKSALVIYPTGAGEARRLESGPIEQHTLAQWMGGSERVFICGLEAGHAERCYVQDVSGGVPRPITPEDTHNGLVSPDSSQVLVRQGASGGSGEGFDLYQVAGGSPRRVVGFEPGDEAIRWAPDGKSVIVRRGRIPARIERVELATGRRDLVTTVAEGAGAGASTVRIVVVADDPHVYAYAVDYQLSQLFLIEGAK